MSGRRGSHYKSNQAVSRVADSQAPGRAKSLHARSERGRQAVRQITILRLLDGARQGLTAQEIHDALEGGCSPRTIYRDVEHLMQAGFQIEAEAGRWRIEHSDSDQRLALPLRPSEVLSLLLTQDLGEPLRETNVFAALDELRQRLAAQLTPEGRKWVEELRVTLRGTLHAPALLRSHTAIIDTAEDACAKEQCLRIVHASPNKEPTERIIEPHLLWYHSGCVYVVAYCRLRHDFRSFAVQRITSAELLDETFDRRAEFDADQFTRRGFGVLHGQVHHFVIDWSKEVAYLVRERLWHPSQELEERGDGLRLKLKAAGLPEIAAWVASFGGQARAVSPPELVEAVRALHREGLAAHGVTSDDKGGA